MRHCSRSTSSHIFLACNPSLFLPFHPTLRIPTQLKTFTLPLISRSIVFIVHPTTGYSLSIIKLILLFKAKNIYWLIVKIMRTIKFPIKVINLMLERARFSFSFWRQEGTELVEFVWWVHKRDCLQLREEETEDYERSREWERDFFSSLIQPVSHEDPHYLIQSCPSSNRAVSPH